MSESTAPTDDIHEIITPWMQIDHADELADRIVTMYRERGDERYSESVTQIEHALQCGGLAEDAGATPETALAAYLHDIGHLLLRANERREDNARRDLHHEDVGGRFLANWFSESVTAPVALHVPAKRYLCATEATYFDTLSPTSVHTLGLQGGPFTDEEAAEFIAQPFAPEAVDVRRWDDLGKVRDARTPDLDHLHSLISSLATLE